MIIPADTSPLSPLVKQMQLGTMELKRKGRPKADFYNVRVLGREAGHRSYRFHRR